MNVAKLGSIWLYYHLSVSPPVPNNIVDNEREVKKNVRDNQRKNLKAVTL